MDKPNTTGDPKAKADRKKFESVEKIPTSPVITRGSRGCRTLSTPELKSPDEKNPKWVLDPEDVFAARKAAKKVKSDPTPQA